MPVPSSPDQWCVALDGVTKSFGSTHALDSLTLRARRGAITAVLGPNGAGKTTMMEICEGLQRADGGRVRVLGMDPASDAVHLRPRVGVMVQDGGLPVMALALELLEHVSRMYARPRDVGELADSLGLHAFARTSVRRLSGGQRQRLALAIALVGRPDLVFLDEPSAGLDPQSRLAVWELVEGLRQDGVSVVLSTHLMDEASHLADHVVIIDHGVLIAEGTVAGLTAPAASGRVRPAAPSGTTPSAVTLRGELTPEALGSLHEWARKHGLAVDATPATNEPAPRTLEDVFLDLTGRSLR